MDSLTLQYIILALVFAFACYTVFKLIRKIFVKGGDNNDKGCDRGCCS